MTNAQYFLGRGIQAQAGTGLLVHIVGARLPYLVFVVGAVYSIQVAIGHAHRNSEITVLSLPTLRSIFWSEIACKGSMHLFNTA